MKYVIPLAAAVILIIFLIVLSQIPLGIEPLTELYFQNSSVLPDNIFLNHVYNYSFTIHNLEYQEMGYNYTIAAYDVNNTFLYQMDSGNIILNNNQSVTIPENFSINQSFGRMEIVVNITKDNLGITPDFKKKLWWPDPNYPTEIDIHFWLDEITGTKIVITQ
jgi:hypothetical protein